LIDLYAAAFEDTYDYCDREPEEVRAEAAREVPRTFGGDEYGWFLAYASRVAEVDGRAVGALLVTEYEGQPHLTYLFVLPAWQRKGLATALVQSAANALRDAGYTELTSTYRPGNEPSRAWHTKFGFVEVMD
jgi:GNAT superfamily N-acetyltransferase